MTRLNRVMIRESAPGPDKRAEAAETAPNSTIVLLCCLDPLCPGPLSLYHAMAFYFAVSVYVLVCNSCSGMACRLAVPVHAAFAGGHEATTSAPMVREEPLWLIFFQVIPFYFLFICFFIHGHSQSVSKSVRPGWRLNAFGCAEGIIFPTNPNNPPLSPPNAPQSPLTQGPPGSCRCSAVPACGGDLRAANAATLIGQLGRAVPVKEGAAPSPGQPSPQVFSSSILLINALPACIAIATRMPTAAALGAF